MPRLPARFCYTKFFSNVVKFNLILMTSPRKNCRISKKLRKGVSIMKRFAKGLAALLIFGAMSFGTVEAAEIPDALENPFETQELKAPPWHEPPPPPRHGHHYGPPHHHRHEPPHFGRRPNDFDPPPPPRHMPPRHHW